MRCPLPLSSVQMSSEPLEKPSRMMLSTWSTSGGACAAAGVEENKNEEGW